MQLLRIYQGLYTFFLSILNPGLNFNETVCSDDKNEP
jgi:hypothetical protein